LYFRISCKIDLSNRIKENVVVQRESGFSKNT
jgi:hypothetical protein